MFEITAPSIANPLSATSPVNRLIATGTAIDAAVLASTNLTYQNGVNLTNAIPTCAIVKYNSGTFGTTVITIKVGTVGLGTGLVLTTLTSSLSRCFANFLTGGLVLNPSDALAVEITSASLSACTFDVLVYGIIYS